MKLRTLFALFFLLATGLTFAQAAKEKIQVRKFHLSSFSKIDVDAQIDVVLVDDEKPGDIYYVGNENYFDDITLKIEDGELKVSARRNLNYKSKITVEIHVNGLQKLSVQKEALVFTSNTLRSGPITVILKGGSKASLKAEGNIYVSADDETELVFEKKTSGVVVNR
jgi:hypothetical protein